MAGDVNLFKKEEGEWEINFMVAEKASRRKGIANEGVLLAMEWSKAVLGAKWIVAKVASENTASQALLEKLGFVGSGGSEAFNEKYFTK